MLHVAQMPPNPNIFQPGPALVFVVINGIPSNGTYVLIGSGNIEAQPTAGASALPSNILQADASGSGSANGTTTTGDGTNTQSSSTSHVALIAGIAGGVAVVALVALGVGICLSRRRRARIRAGIAASKAAQAAATPYPKKHQPASESRVFLQDPNDNQPWSQPDTQSWTQSTPTFDQYRDSGDLDMTPVSAHPVSHYDTGADPYGYQQQHRY